MKLKIKSSLLVICVLIIAGAMVGCGQVENTADGQLSDEKDYTILVMLNGTDLEYDAGAATSDLFEMIEAGGSDENVNIIVQTGGTNGWNVEGISNEISQRWYVTDYGDIELLEDVGAVNIGDSTTVSDFIAFGTENYPAQKYALFFWNHGGGPLGGYGHDDYYDDSLSFVENYKALQTAYDNTGIKFEIIGYDCCLMGSYEYYKMLAPFSNYFIASEELEPGHGWNYEYAFKELKDNPSMDGGEFGTRIVEGFFEQAYASDTSRECTLAVLDCAYAGEIEVAVENLSDAIELYSYDQSISDAVIRARLNSEEYGTNPYPEYSLDLVDLYDLCNNLPDVLSEETETLKDMLDNIIVASDSGQDRPKSRGLSIYWPAKNMTQFNEKANLINPIYTENLSNTRYLSMINSLYTTGGSNDMDTSTTSINSEGSWQGPYEIPFSDGNYYENMYLFLDSNQSISDTSIMYDCSYDVYYFGEFGIGGEFVVSEVYDGSDLANNKGSANTILFDENNVVSKDEVRSSSDKYLPIGELGDDDEVLSIIYNPEDYDKIDTVYLCVGMLMDDSDDVLIMGLDTDVYYEDDGTIWTELYEGWETLNGQFIAMYELSYDEDNNIARYGIPVELNGEDYYLIVVYDDENPDGIITGARKLKEDGTPDKILVQPQIGDTITPYYEYETYDSVEYVLGDTFVVEGELSIDFAPFPDGEYAFGFEVIDIYQNREYSDFVIFEFVEQ